MPHKASWTTTDKYGNRMTREVDDLALIECGMCHGDGKLLHRGGLCPECKGDGRKVVFRIKFYESNYQRNERPSR